MHRPCAFVARATRDRVVSASALRDGGWCAGNMLMYPFEGRLDEASFLDTMELDRLIFGNLWWCPGCIQFHFHSQQPSPRPHLHSSSPNSSSVSRKAHHYSSYAVVLDGGRGQTGGCCRRRTAIIQDAVHVQETMRRNQTDVLTRSMYSLDLTS